MPHQSNQDSNGAVLATLKLVLIIWVVDFYHTQHIYAKKTEYEKDLEFQEAFEESKLVPNMIKAVPWDILEVEYDNGTVHNGNTLVIHQVWRKPSDLVWEKVPGGFYTLLFLAPDHPDPSNPRFKEYLLWFVVNIRENDIKRGDVIAEYIMPPPPEKIGRQRYVFLVLEQKGTGMSKIEEEYIPPIPEDQARANFSTKRFIAKYGMTETPSAGNFFCIDWGVHT